MKKQLTSYFGFSKKELNGIIVLLLLISLILVYPFYWRIFDKPETYDLLTFQKEIDLFKASANDRDRNYSSLKERIEEDSRKAEYFDFDPNTASAFEWRKLGLSARQVKTIGNYRAKGGKFFKKDDLKKIYSITEEQFEKLEPYIQIKSAEPRSSSNLKLPAFANEKKEKRIVIVEINAADSLTLDQLRGIGPAFASRIIRYRNRLGGFYRKEQLKEVYGMDSLRYVLLESQIEIDLTSIKRLNVNTATFEELRNHPYLSYKQINALIQYRKQHGKYSTSGDLKKVLILNEEIIRKIEPYLSFDP